MLLLLHCMASTVDGHTVNPGSHWCLLGGRGSDDVKAAALLLGLLHASSGSMIARMIAIENALVNSAQCKQSLTLETPVMLGRQLLSWFGRKHDLALSFHMAGAVVHCSTRVVLQ